MVLELSIYLCTVSVRMCIVLTGREESPVLTPRYMYAHSRTLMVLYRLAQKV